jgi:hypothetical protein
MSTEHDDRDDIPDADAPASRTEETGAAEFADNVSRVLDGERLPPAMTAEQRSLANFASMIRSSTRDVVLSEEKRTSIVSQALGRAAKDERPLSISAIEAIQPIKKDKNKDEVKDSGGDPGSGKNLLLPWSLALVASAAALALWFGTRNPATSAPRADSVEIKEHHRSRHSDALIGAIARQDSDRASARIDVIFANRMHGYRDLQLTPGARR